MAGAREVLPLAPQQQSHGETIRPSGQERVERVRLITSCLTGCQQGNPVKGT
jgi:hypothetical protein